MSRGARLAEAGSHEELMCKRGKYAAFVNHLHHESDEQAPVKQLALRDAHANPDEAGSAASKLQTALQKAAAMVQREFLGARSAPIDGAEVETVRPVPMALLKTVSELRRTLQQIEDASAIRLPLGDDAMLRRLTSSFSQPESVPGTPRADDDLNGIAGTDYRSPR